MVPNRGLGIYLILGEQLSFVGNTQNGHFLFNIPGSKVVAFVWRRKSWCRRRVASSNWHHVELDGPVKTKPDSWSSGRVPGLVLMVGDRIYRHHEARTLPDVLLSRSSI